MKKETKINIKKIIRVIKKNTSYVSVYPKYLQVLLELQEYLVSLLSEPLPSLLSQKELLLLLPALPAAAAVVSIGQVRHAGRQRYH